MRSAVGGSPAPAPQVAAQASEAERLLAESIAERSKLQARYLALGAKLDLIVRSDAASAQRMRQARTPRQP